MKWVIALVSLLGAVGGLTFAWGLLAWGWWDLPAEMRAIVVFLMLLLHAAVILLVYVAVMVWKVENEMRDLSKEE